VATAVAHRTAWPSGLLIATTRLPLAILESPWAKGHVVSRMRVCRAADIAKIPLITARLPDMGSFAEVVPASACRADRVVLRG
jgi:hypothetical protein